MNTALETANYFLSLAAEHDDELDQLKLQKLCYYAQGYNLAMRGEPLFDEPIEAWEKGPVVRDLRRHFGSYDAHPIPADPSFDRTVFGVMEGALLHSIYRELSIASGSDLVTKTHGNALGRRRVSGMLTCAQTPCASTSERNSRARIAPRRRISTRWRNRSRARRRMWPRVATGRRVDLLAPWIRLRPYAAR